jgi:sugar/nucleoside kinase (ribokinase family)
MQSVRFVAVGELLVDVVGEGSGHDARIGVAPGGSAFNAAVTAAALGADATVIGAVGDDPAGRMIVKELEGRGVRAEATIRQGSTGVFLLAGREIRVDRGVSRELDLPATIEADVVLVSGYLTTETITAALARAQAPWVALDAARLDELPAGGNAVLANEEAARRLTGKGSEEAATELGERYRLACVTRAALGAVAVLDGRLETAAAYPVAGDPPGAGDAFAAGVLVELAQGAELRRALAEGCRWGALAAASPVGWSMFGAPEARRKESL